MIYQRVRRRMILHEADTGIRDVKNPISSATPSSLIPPSRGNAR
jgi:hypothetical protein